MRTTRISACILPAWAWSSLALAALWCCGCSTAPVADFLDYFYPAKIKVDPKVQPYGGVCGPDGEGPNLPALPPISFPPNPSNPPLPTLPSLPPPPPPTR